MCSSKYTPVHNMFSNLMFQNTNNFCCFNSNTCCSMSDNLLISTTDFADTLRIKTNT